MIGCDDDESIPVINVEVFMNKKYQIFISSTYNDLIPERDKVRDVILSMYQFPIGMEMFSAANEEQWEIIQETIDSSDYYVLIIGKRYGSLIEDGPDQGISYTEKEYRYAKSIGMPILAYIKNDEAITADNVDNDPEKLKKLDALKKDVIKGREVKWFSSVDQLGTEVTLSLYKEIDRNKRPGWIRSDAIDFEKSLSGIIELSKQYRELQEESSLLNKLYKGLDPWGEELEIEILRQKNNHIVCYWKNYLSEPNIIVDKVMDLIVNEHGNCKYNLNVKVPSEKDLKKYFQYMYSGTIHFGNSELLITFNDGQCMTYLYGGAGADDYEFSGAYRMGADLSTILTLEGNN